MTNDARTEMLRGIRAALADRPVPAPVRRDYQQRRDLGDLVGLATERISAYEATVHVVPAAELPRTIGALLTERAITEMVAPADLPGAWRVAPARWRSDRPDRPLTVAELDAAGGVLTGCALAIAETGTIVLDGDQAQGRRVLSLLPDYHLCVVRAGQIVGTVAEAVAGLDPLRPLTFISGPSATSDIEFDRVEGVHGPRTLEVIILTGS